jgi:ferredoxin-NADP reductase
MHRAYCARIPQTVGDILLRAELDALARAHAGRVRVWHVVDRLDDEVVVVATGGDDAQVAASSSSRAWPYSTGLVNADILRAHLPPPAAPGAGGDAPLILLCGPPGLERAARKLLAGLGHPGQRVADF